MSAPVMEWPRATVMDLAGKASVDPRTAQKALEHGTSAVRQHLARQRIVAAMKEMGILPGAKQ